MSMRLWMCVSEGVVPECAGLGRSRKRAVSGIKTKGLTSELEMRAACPQEKDATVQSKTPWFSCCDIC